MLRSMMTPQPMIDWLTSELERRNMSQAEASRRAGLAGNAISVVMAGSRPGLRICEALAAYFDVPLIKVLRLAGYEVGPAEQDDEVMEAATLVSKLPPERRTIALSLLRALIKGT